MSELTVAGSPDQDLELREELSAGAEAALAWFFALSKSPNTVATQQAQLCAGTSNRGAFT